MLYQEIPPRLLTQVDAPVTAWCPNGTSIKQGCEKSWVWTPNEGLLPDDGVLKDSLFVFLPGTGGAPAGNTFVHNMAAFAGYRTVGVAYYNKEKISCWCNPSGEGCPTDLSEQAPTCPGATDNSCYPSAGTYWQECGYKMQMERFTGVDRCTPDPIVMDRKDSVAYRLLLALREAKAADLANGDEDGDGNANDWQFGEYCVDPTCPIGNAPPGGSEYFDRIRWDRVVLGGFSQGAGYPQVWSLTRHLRGLVSVDGGNFLCGGGSALASYYSVIPPLYGGTAGGASAGPSELGLFHALRPWPLGTTGQVPPAWPYVELSSSFQNLDTDEAPYWNLGHDVERTAQVNVGGAIGGAGADGPHHGSMAFNPRMPREAQWNTGDPNGGILEDAYGEVWKLHVFERYVAGFCNVGD
jgi:hypothetical protein